MNQNSKILWKAIRYAKRMHAYSGVAFPRATLPGWFYAPLGWEFRDGKMQHRESHQNNSDGEAASA